LSVVGVAAGQPAFARHAALVLALIPLMFLISGVFLRYAAFQYTAPDQGFSQYLSAMCRWDCGWYLGLAEHGYEPFHGPEGRVVGSWSFFPLYPLVVSVVWSTLQISTLSSALIVSMSCSYAACLAAWPLLEGNLRAYVLYCAFLLSGPFSFHYAMPLTEPLAVLLMTLVFVALQRSRFLAAGLASALLSATRVVGVFVVVATVFKIYSDFRERGGDAFSFPRFLVRRPDLLLAILLSPVGLFAYMLLLHTTVGDGFAFGHVQRAFGRVLDNPLLHFWENASTTPQTGWFPTAHQWGATAVVVALALCAVLAMRKQYGAAAFCTICVILPITSGLASIVRYVCALVPLTTLLACLLARSRFSFHLALIAILTSCYFVTIAWFRGHLALV
jgi:hypothetical protein